MPFYAVVSGKNPGIYTNWDDCRAQITNYPGAWYKKFKTEQEADKCMKSKDIVLKSSGLAAYTAQQITDYTQAPWMARSVSRNPAPDTFSSQMRVNYDNSSGEKKLSRKEYQESMAYLDFYHAKVPGMHNRMNWIEKNVTSKLTRLNTHCSSQAKTKQNRSRKQSIRVVTKRIQLIHHLRLHSDWLLSTYILLCLFLTGAVCCQPYPLAPVHTKQRDLSNMLASQPPCFDLWGNLHNPMPYAFDSNWLHAIHSNQIYVPPLIEDYEGFIDVYIDGAVSRKKGSKPRGGIGVWFNHAHPLNITAPMEGNVSPVSAEIQAAYRAIQQAAAAGLTRLNIHTDSLYLVKSITEWIKTWRRNHWQTNSGKTVKYREALERLSDIMGCMDAVRWIHIKSHQGNEGNESADSLARNGVNIYGIKKFDAYIIKESPAK